MGAPTSKPRPRRLTQAERSAATRQALLDSTIDSLIELGYERTTTGEISERAGLSRGAHMHHFQTRSALIVAAAHELGLRTATDLEQRLETLPDGARRPEAALDMVWDLFTGPLFQAVLELGIHARTDPELGELFGPLERLARRESAQALRGAFGGDPADPTLDDTIALVLCTVRGLAILPILDPGYDPARRWRSCRKQLLALVRETAGA